MRLDTINVQPLFTRVEPSGVGCNPKSPAGWNKQCPGVDTRIRQIALGDWVVQLPTLSYSLCASTI